MYLFDVIQRCLLSAKSKSFRNPAEAWVFDYLIIFHFFISFLLRALIN